MRELVPNSYIVLAGICLQWFSLFDIMDGLRARRLKCGSPLGRIIDEGKKSLLKFYYRIGLTCIFMYRNDCWIYAEIRARFIIS